ncbi:DUF3892 domain-containing protein [Microbacterium oxydans]|uniref:DUF3892 domain-containing protein n=1 Tax=Microbacterium oxydans TaxID=82380 RepID=A0A0F0LCW0_9MICO|nr:DUF3892 domain-containing protein [Microbacterium oxydans]KJL31052.1 hypothetical protein RS83_00503 [Microbacterium oxydans]
MTLQVMAVRKDHDGNITHLRGAGWEATIERVIGDIDAGRYRYIVLVGGQAADVFVAPATTYWKQHLRTTADTTTRNTLDALPLFSSKDV